MKHIAYDKQDLLTAFANARPLDAIVIADDIVVGDQPLHLPGGVDLVGLPPYRPVLSFHGNIPLKENLCCVNLAPGEYSTRISNLEIYVASKPGILCAPLGMSPNRYTIYKSSVLIDSCRIIGASDALYLHNSSVDVEIHNTTLSSNFDLVYLSADARLTMMKSRLVWNRDPVGTGNVCISWGAVLGKSSMNIYDSRLEFFEISDGVHAAKGLTFLSTDDVKLENCTFINPSNLPMVNVIGVPGLSTGRFIIK